MTEEEKMKKAKKEKEEKEKKEKQEKEKKEKSNNGNGNGQKNGHSKYSEDKGEDVGDGVIVRGPCYEYGCGNGHEMVCAQKNKNKREELCVPAHNVHIILNEHSANVCGPCGSSTKHERGLRGSWFGFWN